MIGEVWWNLQAEDTIHSEKNIYQELNMLFIVCLPS